MNADGHRSSAKDGTIRPWLIVTISIGVHLCPSVAHSSTDSGRSPRADLAVADWRALLERCDVARFANVGFTDDEWAAVLNQARNRIASSLPVGEAANSASVDPVGEKA